MKKKMKSMISILLVIGMLLPMCNIQSRAAEANWLWPVPASRTIGTWYSDGGHDGLDIWGAYNTPIVASKSGTVVKVLHGDELPNWEGYGHGVVINHGDGYYSHYAHMASVSVSQGQYVSQGQQIGCMGSSGNSTGTHLHFAIATRVYGAGGRINNNPGAINYIYSAETGQTITPATLSCTVGNSVSATKFSWNGGTDCELYNLRIFRKVNGTYTDTNSVWNLKTRSHNVVLPAGDYRAYVDCVIGSNYKASNEVYFTVKSSSEDLGQSFDARILQSTSKCPIGVEQEYKYDVKLLASNHYVEEYWHFERQSDGSYVMKSLYNGDVLDCANAEKVNGTNVCTFRWHEHDAQRWYIYSAGNGCYRFVPKHAQHLSLDLYGGGTTPGTNVQLYEWNGGANQKFSIEKATVIPIKTLALSNRTLMVGESATLSAEKTPSDANMTKLTWSSSNPAVATVDSNGIVKAKQVGTTKITVTSQFDKRISAQATITVQEWKEWKYTKNSDGTITLWKYMGSAAEVVVPAVYDGYPVSIVGDSFYGNTMIKKVVISEGITELTGGTFYNCQNLESVILPDSLEKLGDGAFSGCKSLKSIILPEKLKVIGNDAFANSGIVSIILPEGITEIGADTFWNADSLQSVTVLGKLTHIGLYAFWNCDNLRTISFAKGVQNIGDQAFDNCKNLKSILIPSSVETIGEEAFKNCEKLEGITVFGNVEQIGEDAFAGCPKDMKVSSTADSALRDYAKTNQISYEVITAVKGDANNNGSVDVNDALAILKYTVQIDQSEFNAAAANCDGKDGITANDALAVLKYTVGLLREFN